MPAIEALRTPDERFANLPNWSFAPSYVDDLPGYEGLRAHYADVGEKNAERVFLCVHGEPSWAFLFRKMIPIFAASGARVVAPDFFGFGRSDKPVDDAAYTVAFHRDYLLALIRRLDLNKITLVVQDWGGLIGLTLPLDIPERIARLLIMNTAFPTGAPPSPGFMAWRAYAAANPDMPVGALFKRAQPDMPDDVAAAYDAPFPDARYKAGVRRFPQLVPIANEAADEAVMAMGRAARDWWANSFNGQSFMAIGAADPVLGPDVMKTVRQSIRNCPEPLVLEGVGHFVQEAGDVVARAALKAWGDAP
jgi:pimeloyl-ACP methyl ester carboxylesterase